MNQNSVQFQEDNSFNAIQQKKISGGFVTKLIIKSGLAKDENQAFIVSVVLIIVMVILSVGIYIFFVQGYSPSTKKSTSSVILLGNENVPR